MKKKQKSKVPTELSVHDYFAAAALTGLLADSSRDVSAEEYTRIAYNIADFMMEQRELAEDSE